jgi:hypothetical protein
VRLGQLLAPYAVRYVVVVGSLAPSIPGFQEPLAYRPPPDLRPALLAQLDLRQIIGQGGFEVYIDDDSLPERAVLAEKPASKSSPAVPTTAPTTTTTTTTTIVAPIPVGSNRSLLGWRPVLRAPPGATEVTGRVPVGRVLAGVAPPDAWELETVTGHVQKATTSFGYAASFDVARPGTVTVKYRGSASHGIELVLEALLWLVLLCLLVGRRSSWARVAGRIRRRSHRRRGRPTPVTDPEDHAGLSLAADTEISDAGVPS